MSHSNISIFVPHIGCPNTCSFCNQHTISGAQNAPSAEDVRCICTQSLAEVREPENAEIAFFGGSFTAIERGYMEELLQTASEFVGDSEFKGIRISTRPDCIDEAVLILLKKYGVTSIELGAQSMCDNVLKANDRGHTAADVENACGLIREYGFELGLQMMIGLYKSTAADEIATMTKISELKPNTVRIYPVVILNGTRLAVLYKSGEYKVFSFDEVLNITVSAMKMFEENGINVIKVGLHASEFVEKDMVGGFYHPAYRELCESLIYRQNMESVLSKIMAVNGDIKEFIFAVNPSCISKALGHKKSNAEYFKRHNIIIKVRGDEKIPKYYCELRR